VVALADATLDQIGALFSDHDGRRVGVAADDRRHHRGVDDAQAVDAAHVQRGIDDRIFIDAHRACADGVVFGLRPAPDVFGECGIVWHRVGQVECPDI